jgi:predicted phage terminase large subunit-like protein
LTAVIDRHSLTALETAFERRRGGLKGKQGSWISPGHLAREVDPAGESCGRQTPALQLVDQVLVDVDNGTSDRVIITFPPQEGKSTRVTEFGPLWMLTRNPERRIVIVSYGADLANVFGRHIRERITSNSGQDGTLDLGLRIAPDNGSVASWRLDGHRGGVRSIGMAGGITGRPADALFIDDPISNREQAESERWRQRAKDFWTDSGSTRLAPGAPVVIVLTRWHEDDMAGWLLGRPDGGRWRVVNIPAQADHDPVKGESDPLGREPGEYMDSVRINEHTGQPRSVADWEALKVEKGSRTWAALYQGRPAPVEGNILERGWWRFYDTPQWVERDDGSRIFPQADDQLMSWDMTFKNTDGTDYVVGQVWMRRGADAYLLDQVRSRMSFVETCQAFRLLAARWPQVTLKIIEDTANGPAVISALARIVPGIVPEQPQGSKVARASAVSPLIEAGNVYLPAPELAPWVGDFVEECAAFPNSKHDDVVDSMSQGLNRLVLQPLLSGEIFDTDDLDVELAEYSVGGTY